MTIIQLPDLGEPPSYEYENGINVRTTVNEKTHRIDDLYHVKKELGIPLADIPHHRLHWIEERPKVKWSRFYTNIPGSGYYPGTAATAARDAAILNLYKRVSKQRIGDLGVSIAELGKTVSYIGTTAIRIATCYRALRKGRVTDAMRALGISDKDNLRGVKFPSGKTHRTGRHLKSYLRYERSKQSKTQFAASAWLEFTYAATPLYYDCHTLAKLAADKFNQVEYDVSHKGYGTASFPTGPYGDWTYSGNIQHRLTARFKVDNPLLRQLNSLGLVNPATIVWELVPFSFVVDWFLPVGDYLESFSAFVGLEYVSGVQSTKVEMSGVGFKQGAEDGSFFPSQTGTVKRTSFDRALLTDVPSMPTPSFDLFNAVSAGHALTGLALLKSVFFNK